MKKPKIKHNDMEVKLKEHDCIDIICPKGYGVQMLFQPTPKITARIYCIKDKSAVLRKSK